MAPLNVLDLIPRNLRTIYLHAFQSLIWNQMATNRFDSYGADHVVMGDLVMDPSHVGVDADENSTCVFFQWCFRSIAPTLLFRLTRIFPIRV